jgi:hypothetical protein
MFYFGIVELVLTTFIQDHDLWRDGEDNDDLAPKAAQGSH